MPHSSIHKKKLKKNLMVGLMILLWVVLIWGVTMIKVARADDSAAQMTGMHQNRIPADLMGPFYSGREKQQESSYARQEGWTDQYHESGEQRFQTQEADRIRRMEQLETSLRRKDGWDAAYNENMGAMMEAEQTDIMRRRAWHEQTSAKPGAWWDAWFQRENEKIEREQ